MRPDVMFPRLNAFPKAAIALLRRFGADDRGVSAIEAAILMPFMISLYLGGVQLSQGGGDVLKVDVAVRSRVVGLGES